MTIMRLSNTEIGAVAGGVTSASTADTTISSELGAIFGAAMKPYKLKILGLALKYSPNFLFTLLTSSWTA
jgi:hypothetical protein